MNELIIAEEILEVGNRLYRKNFVASNDGNISARLDQDRFMITASGICKGDLTLGDITIVDMNGNILSGNKKPSSELKMHMAVYNMRSDVCGIVHAHPQKTTAFAVAGIPLDRITLPEVVFSLGNIAFAEYGTPSTQQIPNSVSKVISNSDAVILANHGALTVGESVLDAYFKMETLEHFASISLYARQIGGERELSYDEKKSLIRIKNDVFGKKDKNCTNCGICIDGKIIKDRVPDCIINAQKNISEINLENVIKTAVEQAFKNNNLI
jgi:L-fuculose-phosphate aldolase